MKERSEGGIKSSLELAMEKMDREGGKSPILTDDQKRRLQGIEQELTAKIAELGILARQRMEEARAAGNVERLQELEEGTAAETARLRREAARKKKMIREEAEG